MTDLPKRTDTAARLTYLERMVNDLTRQQGAQINPNSSDYVVNVRELGAVGDGVTDDRSAFGQAMDLICGEGGGTIYVPPGTYVINGVVELCSNLVIMGDGATITKTVWSPYSVFVALSHGNTGYGSSVKNVMATGLRFLGDFAGDNSICGFALHHAADVTIERCIFEQAQGTGHCIDLNGCDGVVVSHCEFVGFNNHLTGGYNRMEAVQLDVSHAGAVSYPDTAGSYDFLLTRNVLVEHCKFLPITVGATTYPCPNPIGAHGQVEGKFYSQIRFRDNYVLDPTEDIPPGSGDNAWLTGVIHLPTVQGLWVENNTFVQTVLRANRVIAVVSMSNGVLAGSDPDSTTPVSGPWGTPVKSTNININGNVITGFKPPVAGSENPTIFVRGVDSGWVENVHINRNTITDGLQTTGPLGKAVLIQKVSKADLGGNTIMSYRFGIDANTVDTVSISRNTFDTLYDWPVVGTTAVGLAIVGNTFTRLRKPVQAQSSCTDVTVVGNTFTLPAITGNDAAGIVMSGNSRYVVSGNVISNSTGTQPRGIAVGAGTGGIVIGNVAIGYTTSVTPAGPPAGTMYSTNNPVPTP